jgi:hypothetical protein
MATSGYLAAGNNRRQGHTFGTDPFAYDARCHWANHAWLFDLGLYLGLRFLGGAWLVALKAAAAPSRC